MMRFDGSKRSGRLAFALSSYCSLNPRRNRLGLPGEFPGYTVIMAKRAHITDTGADLSPDRVYRYRLWRRWGDGPCMTFIGLNPSTADETEDDQTIKKCIGFAQRNGCEAIEMLNLFAFRATEPSDMKAAVDPIGPENDNVLVEHASEARFVIACWGVHGSFRQRDVAVTRMLLAAGIPVKCLGVTQQGYPCHPVVRAYDAEIVDFNC